jgi:hypothetical protein
MIRILVAPISSTAHPVTAIDPVTPPVPLAGVSNDPSGGKLAPISTVKLIVAVGLFAAPVVVNVTVPETAPTVGSVWAVFWIATVIVSLMVPDAGVTVIQG